MEYEWSLEQHNSQENTVTFGEKKRKIVFFCIFENYIQIYGNFCDSR